jgi:ribosomal protein S15P/S13E
METPRTVRLILGSLAFVIAFAGACVVIRETFPFPDVPIVRSKLVHFEAHRNDFDTLFIGTSRIHYQVIPALFDEKAAAAGMPTTSFNAGIAALRPPEDSYFLDRLLAARPGKLRWVFIEINSIRTDIARDHKGTMRAQYWHDWPRLWLMWQRVTALKPTEKRRSPAKVWRELREPLADFPQHLDLFAREMSNLGRGDFLTRQLLYKPAPWDPAQGGHLGDDLRGWTETSRGEEMTPENQARFEQERAARLVKPSVRDTSDPASQRALEEMIEKIERLGATPVLIVAPVTAKKVFVPRPERAQRTIVLDFSDPARFPELYENRNRLDTDHLNTAGAKVFTRLVVEHWLAALKDRGLMR